MLEARVRVTVCAILFVGCLDHFLRFGYVVDLIRGFVRHVLELKDDGRSEQNGVSYWYLAV